MLGLYNKCIQSLDNYPNVVKDVNISWDIVDEVYADTTVSWDIDANAVEIYKDTTLLWGIASEVYLDTNMEYRIAWELSNVEVDTNISWNISGVVYKDFTIQWDSLDFDENYNKIINQNSHTVYDYTVNMTPGVDITASSYYDPDIDDRGSPDKAFDTEDNRQYEGSKWVSTHANTANTPSNQAEPSAGGDLSTCWWQMKISSTRTESVTAMRFCIPDNLYSIESGLGSGNENYDNTPSKIRVLISPDANFGTPANIITVMTARSVPYDGFANVWTDWLKLTSTFTTATDLYLRIEVWELQRAGDATFDGVGFKSFEFATEVEQIYTGITQYMTDTGAKLFYAPYRPMSELVDTVILENRVNAGNGDLTVDFQGNGSSVLQYAPTNHGAIAQEDSLYAGFLYNIGDGDLSSTKMDAGSGGLALDEAKDEWTLLYVGDQWNNQIILNAEGGGTPVMELSDTQLKMRAGDGSQQTHTVSTDPNRGVKFIVRDQAEASLHIFHGSHVNGFTREIYTGEFASTLDSGYSISSTNPVTIESKYPYGNAYVGMVALWPRKLSIAEMYHVILLMKLGTNIEANSMALTRYINGVDSVGELFESTLLIPEDYYDVGDPVTIKKLQSALSFWKADYGSAASTYNLIEHTTNGYKLYLLF